MDDTNNNIIIICPLQPRSCIDVDQQNRLRNQEASAEHKHIVPPHIDPPMDKRYLGSCPCSIL